jgi:hypothetical protein
VGEYIPTTSTINSAPRFDHNPTTGESLGLLVEEQRTNSIRNSTGVGAVAGTPGTLPTNWFTYSSAGSGITRNVVGIGVESGVAYVDLQFVGTPSANAVWSAIFENAGVVSAATGQTWTGSFWVKRSGGSSSNVSNMVLFFDETNGNTFVVGGATAITIGTSWQRVSASRTLSGGATVNSVNLGARFSVTAGQPIDITLRIGLPQLEQGAFATSVIPTTTATVTRSADVASISGSNFSAWYRQDEGTMFGSYRGVANIESSGTRRVVEIGVSGSTSNRMILGFNSTIASRFLVVASSSSQADQSASATQGSQTSIAAAYKTDDFVIASNNVLSAGDTSGTVPVVSAIAIGNDFTGGTSTSLNGTIRRLCFWPRRLGNEVLQEVTR